MKSKKNNTTDGETRTETISLRFTKKEIKDIENIAKQLDMPKTRFMRNLLISSLDDAKILHKLGVLKGTKKLIDFKERLLNPEKYQTLQEA